MLFFSSSPSTVKKIFKYTCWLAVWEEDCYKPCLSGICDVCIMTSSQNVLLAVMELCRRYGSSCLYCLNSSDLSTLLGDSFVYSLGGVLCVCYHWRYNGEHC